MKTIIADSIRFFIVMAVMASVSQTLRSQSAPSRILSLEEMFSLADERSKAIKVYESAIDVANKNIDVAKNAYLPHINVTASATYNGNAWVANRDFSNGQFFPSPHFGNSYAIEASQVVFAGGAILGNIKVMEIQKRIAEWNLKAKRQEIYFLLTGFYLDLYKFRNLKNVYERNIEQTKQVISDMHARQAAGIVLNNDITRYEVQLQNLEYGLTELKSSIEICNTRLTVMLGLPEETQIFPDTSLLYDELRHTENADILSNALLNSPALNMRRLTENVLDQKMKIIKAAYLPQINLIAGDNLKGPITYEIPVVNANINTWYLGVGLNFNIGNIYRLPKETSRLKSAMLQNRNELSEAEENTELDVRAAQIRYLDSFELLKTQEKSLQLARENYDITANRYANDLVLIIDLVDADNLRLNAEVQYENAKINIAYAYYKLLYTAGILNSQNL